MFMKKLLLLIALILPIFTFSQNVGIGTTTPTAKLDIDGSLRLRGSLTIDSLKTQSGTTWLIINSLGRVDTTSMSIVGPVGPQGPQGLQGIQGIQGIQGPAGTSATPNTADNGLTITSNNIRLGGTLVQNTIISQDGFNFRFTGTGSVGIGNLSGGGTPSHKLHVAGGIRAEDGMLANDGTVGLPGYRFSADVDNGMYRAATNSIGLVTAGAERIRILANGNVGINTATPNSVLSFNGGLQGKVRVITTEAAVTLDNTDFYVISTNGFTANRTMTLPTLTAGTTDGKILIIRNAGNNATGLGWNLAAASGNSISFSGIYVNPLLSAEGVIFLSRSTVWYQIAF